jgi:AmmeMemoRadiSam system protein A
MAPTSLSRDAAPLTAPLRAQLLRVAREAIRVGFGGTRLSIRAADYSAPLQRLGASFVTLHVQGQLRGCIGSIDARRPLVADVARNAYAAAFEDERFAPMDDAGFAALAIHLSLLSAPEPLRFSSEADLVAQLRPHVDGLVLQEGRRHATFLPSVWEQVPEAVEFLRHLKLKAGLPGGYWSPSLRIQRYRVESIT